MGSLLNKIRGGNQHLLAVFGLLRNDKGETVVAYNRRPLSLITIEHMCCKLYLALSRSYGTRAYNKPTPLRTHCPPTQSMDLVPKGMVKIMEESIRTFEAMVRDKKWPFLPRKFWMAAEGHEDMAVDDSLEGGKTNQASYHGNEQKSRNSPTGNYMVCCMQTVS